MGCELKDKVHSSTETDQKRRFWSDFIQQCRNSFCRFGQSLLFWRKKFWRDCLAFYNNVIICWWVLTVDDLHEFNFWLITCSHIVVRMTFWKHKVSVFTQKNCFSNLYSNFCLVTENEELTESHGFGLDSCIQVCVRNASETPSTEQFQNIDQFCKLMDPRWDEKRPAKFVLDCYGDEEKQR